jgi:hypothetical protein
VGVVVIGGGAYYLLRPGAPEPPTPPPTTVAVATTLPPPETLPPEPPPTTQAAPIEETVPVTAPPATVAPVATPPPVTTAPRPVATPPPATRPTPAPSAKPAATPPPAPAQPSEAQLAQQRAAQVANLLAQADAAVAANKPDQALAHFDAVLKLEPQNAKAAAGKAAATTTLAFLKKAFTPGNTAFIGKPKKGPAGFDDNEAADPDYQGRVEYEFNPPRVKPGDTLTAKAFLVNEGKKTIKVGSISVATVINGRRTPGPSSPQTKEVAPGQRALLAETSTAWRPDTAAWILEVIVTSDRKETYSSRASWR